MPTFTPALTDLPTTQFTAGAFLKIAPEGTKIQDIRAGLDALVEQGLLTVKVAKSLARNYRLTAKGKTEAAAEWEGSARRPADEVAARRAKRAGKKAPARKAAAKRTTAAKKAARPRKAAAKRTDGTPRGTTVRFVIDGKPMPDSQNKLSSVAWYHTAKIGGDDVKRIDVTALRGIFAVVGEADPSNTVGVDVTLPNGKQVTTVAL